jgi:ABC-type glycerol-3-phosphate transport system permease component
MAIQMAYLANAALCLFNFFGEWEVGAYCALVAASTFTLQIILISVRQAEGGTEWQTE